MKTFLLMVFLIATTRSFSQSIFPSLSPEGRVSQNIGNTNIAIVYERPAARGRQVFGELVPYGKLWRTGAGHCTRISFNKPIVINGENVGKGTYALLTIPGAREWTIILNTDTTLYGVGDYDERKDLLRFKVPAQSTGRYYESFTIDIDIIPNNAVLYMVWEKTQVSFVIATETDHVVSNFVKKNLLTDKSKDSDEYAAAAEYYFYLNKDLDQALVLINKAIAKKNESWYYRQKIDILEKQKKYQEAIECAYLAISLDQKRTGWDATTKQQSEQAYQEKIKALKSRVQK